MSENGNSRIVSEQKPPIINPQDMLGLIGLALLVLVGFGAIMYLNWNSWGKPVFFGGVIVGALVTGWKVFTIGHDRYLHHKDRTITHTHTTTQLELAQKAMAMGHSVSMEHIDHLGRTIKLQTISPLTIPNAPVTIKEVNYGTEQEQLPPPLPIAPPFRSLISQIRPGHLFLAQGQEKPIWGDITDLLSTLDVGRPGTGKSTLLRMVCGQVMIIGGEPIIFDPHGSILDSLGSEFECAESPRDIVQYAKSIDGWLTGRLQQRRAGQIDFKPMLLLVDEMPIIAEMAVEALPVIRRVVLEGRKVGMYALVSGQGVPASTLGGTLVRDAMASRYVFCTSAQQARMAGIENETAKSMMAILEDAGPGKAVLATSNRKPEIVAIPDTSTDDIRFLLSRNVSGNVRNQPEIRNISGDFRNDVKSDIGPIEGGLSEISDSGVVERSIDVLPETRNEIIRLRKEGFNRTEIRNILHFNGEQFKIIKQVLDAEGL